MLVSNPFDDFCQSLTLLLKIERSGGIEEFLDEEVEAIDPGEAPLLDIWLPIGSSRRFELKIG